MSSTTVLQKLSEKFSESSKTSFQKWIKQKRVFINQRLVKRGDESVFEGEELVLKKKKQHKLPFEILYSDPYILVVDKPPGMLSVASLDPSEISVHKLLKQFLKSEKLAPLHRLDKEVSGPLIFVKNQKCFDRFKDLFVDRKIEREYRAIVVGEIESDEGKFESYLTEGKNYKAHSTSQREGKYALTSYKVLSKSKNYSYLSLKLDTGRKNQIRVHLSEAGYPIVGDKKYGEFKANFKGLALFAYSLSFEHPFLKKRLSFSKSAPYVFERFLKKEKLF